MHNNTKNAHPFKIIHSCLAIFSKFLLNILSIRKVKPLLLTFWLLLLFAIFICKYIICLFKKNNKNYEKGKEKENKDDERECERIK